MTVAGILIGSYDSNQVSFATRFIQPMAVGLVAYAAYTFTQKIIRTPRAIVIMAGAAVISFFVKSPFVFPAILLVAGCITAFNYKAHPREENKKFNVPWANFFLWMGVLIMAAVVGAFTKNNPDFLPVRLFENFYRNGSLIFGGGQVLTPLLHTEFVQYAKPTIDGMRQPYLTNQEFLSGYALAQSLPGPVFSFSSYLGALSMHSRGFGITGQIVGAVMSAIGIFLPGTFLIFFMVRIWESLKKFRPIRASLDGINAASAGLIAAAAFILFQPLRGEWVNYPIVLATFLLMAFTKLPSWAVIFGGLLLGLLLR
jgi:chromate transporter